MNRLTEALALCCLLVTVLGFYTRIADQLPGLEREERDSLSVISHVLHDFGLHHRADVAVKLDARPVAAGFSLLDCDGLLLIASLPETAQGWGHLAPRLDLDSYTVRYGYAGAWHKEVPRVQRLVDRLVYDFKKTPNPARPHVVAVAEAGKCGLTDAAESTLLDYSRGMENLLLAHAIHHNV